MGRGWTAQGRDRRRGRGTNGDQSLTNGGAHQRRVWAIGAIGGLVFVVDTADVLTRLHDAGVSGARLRLWEPATWEYTSGVACVSASGLVYLGLRLARIVRRSPWRVAAVHVAMSLAFSLAHIVGMVVLRMLIYALRGLPYHLPLSDLPYEYPKDVASYAIFAVIFWIAARGRIVDSPVAKRPAPKFRIVCDGREIPTLLDEIAYVRCAGNYVEFHLRDGRPLLMRTTLRHVQAGVKSEAFMRIHRSWLVNLAAVQRLEAAGSGDFRVILHDGAAAPLARRNRTALQALRAKIDEVRQVA
jgi:LytTr DNA-binding domain